jgi:hypothetical protein
MDKGEDIEERAVGIAGQVDALRTELLPGGTLARAAGFDKAGGGQGAARKFQRGTAREGRGY